jgi:hypothetical protein
MVDFHTKNHNFGIFFSALKWKMLVYVFYVYLLYFMAVLYISLPFGICILWPFGIFYGHLVIGSVVLIWYIFPFLATLCQEKSGNPDELALFCQLVKTFNSLSGQHGPPQRLHIRHSCVPCTILRTYVRTRFCTLIRIK